MKEGEGGLKILELEIVAVIHISLLVELLPVDLLASHFDIF